MPAYALSFDGASQYASASHNAELDLASAWTIEFWAKASSPGTFKYLLTHTNGSNAGWAIYTGSAGSIRVYFGNGSALSLIDDPGANPWDNTWRHFAFVMDSTAQTISLYATPVSGTSTDADVLWVSTSTGTNTAQPYTGTLYLASYDGTQLYWGGQVDDLRIWNVTRTLTQINANKDSQLTGSQTGLVGYWTFNEGTGTTAADSTATTENFTLSGATWVTGHVPPAVTGLLTGTANGAATTSGTLAGSTYVPTVSTVATVGAVLGPTGGSTQSHLIFARNTSRWWFFSWGGTLDSGTATGGTNQTLVDSTKNWSAQASSGAFLGRSCVITSGTGAGNTFEIGTVTSTSIKLQDNGDPSTPYTLNFTPDNTTHYTIVESRTIKAYVSDRVDLATAVWSQASETSPIINGVGVDTPGGRWDGGFLGGEYPTDGRQLTVAYADISGYDIVYVMVQTGVHWFKVLRRGHITGTATLTWDDMIWTTNTWDDTIGDQEALPYFMQGMAMAFDTNNSRWHCVWCKTQGMAGSAWTVNDPGTGTGYTLGAHWGGYVQTNTFDSTTNNNSGTNYPYQAALAELGSGTMLVVYTAGNVPTTPGTANKAQQTGLRFAKSSSATAWPTTNVGAAVPSLGSGTNSPNDWSIVRRTATDIHIVRRNSSTTLEQIRYNGTSWGSVVTLPTTGLTGHAANSGVVLSTDGTDVWCVVLDSDTSHTLRYCKWTGASGTWDSSWSSLSTNNNQKAFLSGYSRVTTDHRIGVVWSEGTLPNVSVVSANLVIPQISRSVPVSVAFRASLSRYVLANSPLRVTLVRTIPITASLIPAAPVTPVPVGITGLLGSSRSLAGFEVFGAPLSLLVTSVRNVPTTATLLLTSQRTVAASSVYSVTHGRVIPATGYFVPEVTVPVADIDVDSWIDQTGAPATYVSFADPSDVNYAQSPSISVGDTSPYTLKFGAIAAPGIGQSLVIDVRVRATGPFFGLRIELEDAHGAAVATRTLSLTTTFQQVRVVYTDTETAAYVAGDGCSLGGQVVLTGTVP